MAGGTSVALFFQGDLGDPMSRLRISDCAVTPVKRKYTYTVPVEALDKGINVAAYSTKNKIWYDRVLTFHSDSLEKTGDLPALENERLRRIRTC